MYNKFQRGQALSEYMVLIPAAIMIVIGASLVTGFVVTSLGKSVDALQPYGVEVCEAQPQVAPEAPEGPTYVEAGDHSIELCGVVYNEADDTTSITYCVTSAACPSISHWTLGIPQSVADNVIETSEPVESWHTDPTTGVTGIKFDTGYEVVDNGGTCGGGNGNGNNGNNGNTQFGNNGVGNGEDGQPPGNPPVNDGEGTSPGNPGNQNGGGNGGNGGNNDNQNGNNGVGNGEDPQPPGNPPVNDGEGSSPGNPGNQNGGGNGNNGNNGNNNGNGNKNNKMASTYARSQSDDPIGTVSRDVTLLVTGQYDFGPIETAVKAGQEVDYVSISAPIRIYEAQLNWECE